MQLEPESGVWEARPVALPVADCTSHANTQLTPVPCPHIGFPPGQWSFGGLLAAARPGPDGHSWTLACPRAQRAQEASEVGDGSFFTWLYHRRAVAEPRIWGPPDPHQMQPCTPGSREEPVARGQRRKGLACPAPLPGPLCCPR